MKYLTVSMRMHPQMHPLFNLIYSSFILLTTEKVRYFFLTPSP